MRGNCDNCSYTHAFFMVQTDRNSVHPPPSNGAKNGFFHLVRPAGHFRHPAPLILGVLNSIISSILINQALAIPKCVFSGSRQTEFPFIPPFSPRYSRQLRHYRQRLGICPISFSKVFYFVCGAYGAPPVPCMAPCVCTHTAPMCLFPYVIRIRCMQCKLRGSEVLLPFNYSFLHLPAGPQCPSVTAAAPT